MGDIMPPFVVAMVPVQDGTVVSDEQQPMYLVKPNQVAQFKKDFDGIPTGLVWVALDNVMDLRGKFPRPLP